jgi:transcription elongation factor GreA-like protein/transcription elongation GreA/GreB family factor
MGYLEEFQLQLETQSYTRFMLLWEEYCQADVVVGEEVLQVLQMIKKSAFAPHFGEHAATIIPIWKQIPEQPIADQVLRLTLDLQTKNDAQFADLATEYLQKKYQNHPHYNDFLRLVGLRTRQKFQNSITNFELLVHLDKGNFVFHTGGWGVGEVMSVSHLREHVLIEFEGITTQKDLSFENAFRNLVAIPSDHFLSRRFGNPDSLEKEGKEDPLALIHLLLRDMGPKSAAEIKDELCDLVIPEQDWTKWWQVARAKIKKDTKIQSPDSSKERFSLRLSAISHDSAFLTELKKAKTAQDLIETAYQYSRDFPEIFKNQEAKELLKERIDEVIKERRMNEDEDVSTKIQLFFLMEDIYDEPATECDKIIAALENVIGVIERIDIIAYKKRILALIRKNRKDWVSLFLKLLFLVQQNMLRDYIFKELLQDTASKDLLRERLQELLTKVALYPDAFFWYFQKICGDEEVPLNDKEHRQQFLEALFVLLHYVEQRAEHKDLIKKIHQLISAKRYLAVRSIIQEATTEYLNEMLLLASKCNSLSKQDQRILSSLAEVVQPSMSKKEEEAERDTVIWTTAEGYKKVQEKIQQIGTVETVENAKEIEAARALGDLRENSEYKFALEQRARLQGELKALSKQLNRARVLTKEDVSLMKVGVGVSVDLTDSKGHKISYTLLGPWDADPDKNILSFQSKLAQAMTGCKKGETFDFQGERYTIQDIRSFL